MEFPHSITSDEVRKHLQEEYPGEESKIAQFIAGIEGLSQETEYLTERAKDPTFTVWAMWMANDMDFITMEYIMFDEEDPVVIKA